MSRGRVARAPRGAARRGRLAPPLGFGRDKARPSRNGYTISETALVETYVHFQKMVAARMGGATSCRAIQSSLIARLEAAPPERAAEVAWFLRLQSGSIAVESGQSQSIAVEGEGCINAQDGDVESAQAALGKRDLGA